MAFLQEDKIILNLEPSAIGEMNKHLTHFFYELGKTMTKVDLQEFFYDSEALQCEASRHKLLARCMKRFTKLELIDFLIEHIELLRNHKGEVKNGN